MVLSGSDNQSVATEGGRSVRIDMNLSVSTASIEPRLAAAAALADSLHASSDVDDELWSQLGDLFSAEEILELLLLVGHYTTTAYVLNALRAG